MDFISNILVPIILSALAGLSFLTYKHPSIARKLIYALAIIFLGVMLVASSYHIGVSNALSSSYYAIHDSDVYNEEFFDSELDSLSNRATSTDSSSKILYKGEYKWFVKRNLLNIQESVQDSISNKVLKMQSANSDGLGDRIGYTLFAGFILIVLLGLTFVFETYLPTNSNNQTN